MGNFISDQILKFLNPRIVGIGIIETFELGDASAVATVRLHGEMDTVRVELTGISWSVEAGKFRIHYATATASKLWIQGILDLLAEKNGKVLSFPDKLSLMPVKMLFPKQKEA